MSGGQTPFEREVRDTVIKSSMTGIAATAIAITAFSPAGFGDWVGASVASSFGVDSTASAADNAYANLPAYPAPLTRAELDEIHSQLAAGEASMAILRAATDTNIEIVRAVSMGEDFTVAVARAAAVAPQPNLRLSLSEPVSYAVDADAAPVEAYVFEGAASAREERASYAAAVVPEGTATYSAAVGGGNYDASTPYRDPHLELADLLLAHEQF